ncbi:MAG: helix-turn-helix domain-containing protein [Rhodothermales bacterium]
MLTLEDVERQHIRQVLEQTHGGSKGNAARPCGQA